MTPQKTTEVVDVSSDSGRRNWLASTPLGITSIGAPGAISASVFCSFSVTTKVVTARSVTSRSKVRSRRASRAYTQDSGGAFVLAKAAHFAESTSTMSSTNGIDWRLGRD